MLANTADLKWRRDIFRERAVMCCMLKFGHGHGTFLIGASVL
jgi:hypothetical protein